MSTQAFALRADHEDFVGGQLAWGPGQQTFDVGEALNQGNGVIVVDLDDSDPTNPGQRLLAEALDNYPALKRISAAEAAKVSPPAPEEEPEAVHGEETYDEATLQAMDKEALWSIVDSTDGLTLKADAKKDDLVTAILKHQKGGDVR